MRTGEIEIGPGPRRTTQRGEEPALLWRFAPERSAQSRSNPLGIGVVFGKPLGQGPDQAAVGIQAENLKSRHAALDLPARIIPERFLLRGIAHGRLPSFTALSRNISRILSVASYRPKTKTEASLPPSLFREPPEA